MCSAHPFVRRPRRAPHPLDPRDPLAGPGAMINEGDIGQSAQGAREDPAGRLVLVSPLAPDPAFSVVTPAYFSQKQVDPWIVAQVDGAELYAVIAQWDDAEELGR